MNNNLKICLALFCITLGLPALAKGPKGMQMPSPIVEAQVVKTQQWQQSIQATGTLSAFNGIVVKPEISGRVTQIFFKSGQDITQGQPIIALDQDVLAAQVKLYQANLALRQEQFTRSAKLYKLHALAQADLQSADSDLRSAQAQVEQAQAQLKQAIITAPFSGRLGLRLVSVGDYVTPGQNIVNLQSLDPIIVNFSVPEIYLNKITVDDAIKIRSDAYPNQPFLGKVYAMDSVIDPNTRSLSMRASIANPQKKLLPGSFVNVSLLAGQAQTVITVPQMAILSSLQGNYVYRVVDGKAVSTPVTILARGNTVTIIKSGLKAGDIVITGGQVKISENNSPVMVAQSTDTKKSS